MKKYSYSSIISSMNLEGVERSFYHNGAKIVARMKKINDAFYEIVSGKFKGNWVHVWDVV